MTIPFAPWSYIRTITSLLWDFFLLKVNKYVYIKHCFCILGTTILNIYVHLRVNNLLALCDGHPLGTGGLILIKSHSCWIAFPWHCVIMGLNHNNKPKNACIYIYIILFLLLPEKLHFCDRFVHLKIWIDRTDWTSPARKISINIQFTLFVKSRQLHFEQGCFIHWN